MIGAMPDASHRPNIFAGPYLDRRTEERESEEWHTEALADVETVCLIARGTTQLLHVDGEEARIAFLAHDHPIVRATNELQRVLLGWYRGARCVLVELPPAEEQPLPLPANARFEELRPKVRALEEPEAALLAYARALAIWRARTRYCGVCGAPAVPRSAGHVMRCSNERCAQEFFPRLDPAIIVLVTDGERALLGRQADWPAGRYSTVAGFVEPGESLEDAVVREVMEETGVGVQGARYQSSQPWPFPSSLMIGFRALAQPGSAVCVGRELEDARWFTPAEIAAGGVMPTSHSISHRLIAEWMAERPR